MNPTENEQLDKEELSPEDRRGCKRVQVLWFNEQNKNEMSRVFVVSHGESHPQKVVVGVVADISRTGVRILIQQRDMIDTDSFKLVIHPPEDLDIPDLELEGTRQWDDATQKNIYTAVGIHINDDSESHQNLEKLADTIDSQPPNEAIIKCEIVFED